jgi:AcrR family transcriptional regulator
VKNSAKSDQLSATDWLDQGLKTLTESGFTALKAEPLAKAMGVSRGSFYWHFADVGAFHAALLKRWREVMTEQIIARLEHSPEGEIPMNVLLRRAFGGNRLTVEVAVRTWATVDSDARAAVQAIDKRRLSYMEGQFVARGYSPAVAQSRAPNSLLGLSRLHSLGQTFAEATSGRNSR